MDSPDEEEETLDTYQNDQSGEGMHQEQEEEEHPGTGGYLFVSGDQGYFNF